MTQNGVGMNSSTGAAENCSTLCCMWLFKKPHFNCTHFGTVWTRVQQRRKSNTFGQKILETVVRIFYKFLDIRKENFAWFLLILSIFNELRWRRIFLNRKQDHLLFIHVDRAIICLGRTNEAWYFRIADLWNIKLAILVRNYIARSVTFFRCIIYKDGEY